MTIRILALIPALAIGVTLHAQHLNADSVMAATEKVAAYFMENYLQGTGACPEDGGVITYESVPNFEDFGIGCWLWGAAEVHALAVQQSGEASDISGTPCVDEHQPAVYYNVSGQRVTHPQKGRLYIRKEGKTAQIVGR